MIIRMPEISRKKLPAIQGRNLGFSLFDICSQRSLKATLNWTLNRRMIIVVIDEDRSNNSDLERSERGTK